MLETFFVAVEWHFVLFLPRPNQNSWAKNKKCERHRATYFRLENWNWGGFACDSHPPSLVVESWISLFHYMSDIIIYCTPTEIVRIFNGIMWDLVWAIENCTQQTNGRHHKKRLKTMFNISKNDHFFCGIASDTIQLWCRKLRQAHQIKTTMH